MSVVWLLPIVCSCNAVAVCCHHRRRLSLRTCKHTIDWVVAVGWRPEQRFVAPHKRVVCSIYAIEFANLAVAFHFTFDSSASSTSKKELYDRQREIYR